MRAFDWIGLSAYRRQKLIVFPIEDKIWDKARQHRRLSFECSAKAGKPSDGFARADVSSGMILRRQLSKGTFGPVMNLML
jgi:hypothetical protein